MNLKFDTMKKGFLCIASLFLGLGVSAQVGTIPSNYWTLFEANYAQYDAWWEVDDQTQNVTALTGLTPTNGMQVEASSISNNAYTITTDGDVFKVHYVKTKDYEKFGLSWMKWEYPAEDCGSDNWQLVNPITGEAWANNCHRTAKGYSIDFSDPANRIVSFKYQAVSDVAVNLRVDLWDIKGRKTTRKGYITTDNLDKTNNYVASDENAWQPFAILYANIDSDPESKLEELYYYNDSIPFFGTSSDTLADGNNTWWNGIQFPSQPNFNLLLDTSRIIGLEIYINCVGTTAGETTDLYIKDLTVGNTITRTGATEYSTGIPTVEGNKEVEITNGIVYSNGKIVVLDILGQPIKSAKNELKVSDLPAGIYFIQTPEGTVKFVK